VSTIGVTTKSRSHKGDEQERAAGFVLYQETDRGRSYLVLQHREGGHWALPKGRIERNENELMAACREIREETGICGVSAIDGFRISSEYRFMRGGTAVHKTVTYFLSLVSDVRVRLSGEHTDAAWLGLDAAVDQLTYVETARILRAADEWLAVSHSA